ncbi:hypothetical protein [Acidovorax sp. SUPP3334]|uniref:hypothetical protein n=1 Tax=Acidovorax sp. SUPP3334 TaxID=2920881 RepID=UPI0023DE2597|nr:hypothetical protein [Acidovorax sp. SUPP3334]GKT22494.1 hypothetical protein AVHM3334_08610 [Acidovorax sp. SUPP3334]
MSTHLSPNDAGALYQALQAGPLAGSPITVLRIGAGHSSIASGTQAQARLLRTLEVGYYATAAACLRHDPPAEGELEHAIQMVEDAVMPVYAVLPPGTTLYTADAGIRQVALAAGVEAQPEMALPLDAVERTFQRLAAVAMGRPPAQEGLPEGTAFAATLLILRECMQHLGFDRIVIRSDTVV